jgi:hypothetical protein
MNRNEAICSVVVSLNEGTFMSPKRLSKIAFWIEAKEHEEPLSQDSYSLSMLLEQINSGRRCLSNLQPYGPLQLF